MLKDHSHAIETLAACIPYFEHVKSIEMDKDDSITFNWHGTKYRICYANISESELKGYLEMNTDTCLLMKALIKKQLIINQQVA